MSTGRTDGVAQAYALARERYAGLGVDAVRALETEANTPISLHCWEGDDVAGFEDPSGELGGGIATTGSYPGKARNYWKRAGAGFGSPCEIDDLSQGRELVRCSCDLVAFEPRASVAWDKANQRYLSVSQRQVER